MYQYGSSVNILLDINYRTGGLDLTTSFWAGSYAHAKCLTKTTAWVLFISMTITLVAA